MAKVVVIGAGFAGQTAALYLKKELGAKHEVTVISGWPKFTYIPSLVWVGVGQMAPEKTQFELAPVLEKHGINFVQAWAREIHVDNQYVLVETKDGVESKVEYDYIINATGPYLNFEGTEGLGPDHGNSHSICNIHHAKMARDAYLEQVKRMEQGEHVKILVGLGHPQATCQGAALEYITNIESDFSARGLRDKATIMWMSNEPALGDLGMGGIQARKHGYIMKSEQFIKSLFAEKGIHFQVQTAVKKVEKGKVHWENYEGEFGETEFDFAMLIPQFKGIKIKYIDKDGNDISAKLTNPAGFLLVDGNYGKPWSELKASDWPKSYQSPFYKNMFAAGIAFAPVGSVSKPHTTKNGTVITASLPRTGMASGIIGKNVALNVVDLINGREPSHLESMAQMPSACIASLGKSINSGAAASMVLYPTVPDYETFPDYGRDLKATSLEVGLSGAWLKRTLHTMFIYKMKGKAGWNIIPE